jgi:hypothetical protein
LVNRVADQDFELQGSDLVKDNLLAVISFSASSGEWQLGSHEAAFELFSEVDKSPRVRLPRSQNMLRSWTYAMGYSEGLSLCTAVRVCSGLVRR